MEPDAVLDYWFGAPPLQPRGKLWWMGGADLDAEIRQRFGDAVEQAMAGELDHWAETPRGALALVILLDQFTRNSFRGSARAFAGDARALDIVLDGLDRGIDRQLHPLEATFFYMPLEHAESMECQDRCVQVFEDLAQRCPDEHREYVESNLQYAHQHRQIIEQFGRYPHRNRVMERESTPEEVEYLASGGQSFGQG